MLVCFFEAVFEADLSMGLWRPPKECTHECSQPSLLLLCRNWFLTGQTGFINFSNCKNRFNQQTSSSQSYFWIQPFKTVLASWAYYIVRMMLYFNYRYTTVIRWSMVVGLFKDISNNWYFSLGVKINGSEQRTAPALINDDTNTRSEMAVVLRWIIAWTGVHNWLR